MASTPTRPTGLDFSKMGGDSTPSGDVLPVVTSAAATGGRRKRSAKTMDQPVGKREAMSPRDTNARVAAATVHKKAVGSGGDKSTPKKKKVSFGCVRSPGSEKPTPVDVHQKKGNIKKEVGEFVTGFYQRYEVLCQSVEGSSKSERGRILREGLKAFYDSKHRSAEVVACISARFEQLLSQIEQGKTAGLNGLSFSPIHLPHVRWLSTVFNSYSTAA